MKVKIKPVQLKSNFFLFVQHRVLMKIKEKEANLLLDQTLMEKKSGCTFIFYLGGCCGHEKKIHMSRQNNSFEEILHYGTCGVVQLKSNFFRFVQHRVRMKLDIKEKEPNLLLDQTLMKKNQVVHLFFIWEGVVVMKRKLIREDRPDNKIVL